MTARRLHWLILGGLLVACWPVGEHESVVVFTPDDEWLADYLHEHVGGRES